MILVEVENCLLCPFRETRRSVSTGDPYYVCLATRMGALVGSVVPLPTKLSAIYVPESHMPGTSSPEKPSWCPLYRFGIQGIFVCAKGHVPKDFNKVGNMWPEDIGKRPVEDPLADEEGT